MEEKAGRIFVTACALVFCLGGTAAADCVDDATDAAAIGKCWEDGRAALDREAQRLDERVSAECARRFGGKECAALDSDMAHRRRGEALSRVYDESRRAAGDAARSVGRALGNAAESLEDIADGVFGKSRTKEE